jgi:hypothetical protein
MILILTLSSLSLHPGVLEEIFSSDLHNLVIATIIDNELVY